MQNIAIFGAGGFGKEVACIIEKINEKKPTWNFLGFFDKIEKGTEISSFGKILGGISELNQWETPISIVFAIGNGQTISRIFGQIDNDNVDFPNIIHPEVFFAHPASFKIGKGNVIVRGCTFSVDVTIGDFNQMNSISSLAHDVKLGSFNILMPLTRISGSVTIGNHNSFGINTIVLQELRVGNNTKTAPSSVLYRNTQDGYLYMGNPAKKTIL